MRIFSGLLLVAAVACGSSTEPQGVVVHVHNPGVVHPGYVKFQIANLIETDSLVPGAIVEDSVYATTAGRYRVATAWNGVAYRSAPFDVK